MSTKQQTRRWDADAEHLLEVTDLQVEFRMREGVVLR